LIQCKKCILFVHERPAMAKVKERTPKEPMRQKSAGNVDSQPSKEGIKIVRPDKAPIRLERKSVPDSQNKQVFIGIQKKVKISNITSTSQKRGEKK